jgi:hypothetical protein
VNGEALGSKEEVQEGLEWKKELIVMRWGEVGSEPTPMCARVRHLQDPKS